MTQRADDDLSNQIDAKFFTSPSDRIDANEVKQVCHDLNDSKANLTVTDDLQTQIDGLAPVGHTHEINEVNGLATALAAKATPADIDAAVSALLAGAPGALDTLKELADAMADDAAFSTTVMNLIAQKSSLGHTHPIGEVVGLQTTLDGKAPLNHTHPTAVLYAESFGVSAGNTAAQNASALLTAIKAALLLGVKLVMPPGDIKCGEVLGTSETDDATHFAMGNKTLHIDIPSGCRILRQAGVWWLNIDVTDGAVLYPLTAAAFGIGTTLGQAGGDPSNLYIYTKYLALGVANASAINKYDRVTLATVPPSGYLVQGDSGDDYGYPVEDLPVLDVNKTTNTVYVGLPKYKGITQYNTRMYHWPRRDVLLKVTGSGDLILDPATGNYEDDTLANAREMIRTIGCRIEICGDYLHLNDSDRGLVHVQRTVGSILSGISTRRTRNQSQGASNTRKLTYIADDYANKELLIERIACEGSRHINTGNTAKTTNRFLLAFLTNTSPLGFYYDATSSALGDGDEVYVDGAGGTTQVNQKYFFVTGSVSVNNSVTTITNANPAVVTYSGSNTGLANDRKVLLTGVVGMTQVNGNWYTVKNLNTTAKTFELWNAAGTAPIDATGYGTFVDSTTDKVSFGYAQLQGVDGTAYAPFTGGGYAFKVSDWVSNGYSTRSFSHGLFARQGQGNGDDKHAGQVDGVTSDYVTSGNVMYWDGLINPKGGNFRGNGDQSWNVSIKNQVQAWTFDGMAIDHLGCGSNLYALINVDVVDLVWEGDQDAFQFAGSSTTTTKKTALLSGVRLRGGAVGRIASLASYTGTVIFDNLTCVADLARVASGTSSRYLFTNNGGAARLVIKDTRLDFRDSNILDSTGAVSTAALKRFGTMFGTGEVELDNFKLWGTAKFDPRYGLFTTDGTGVKKIYTRNFWMDNPDFPVVAKPDVTKSIASATATSPIVITTTTAHGYANNEKVYHELLTQMTGLNQTFDKVTVISPTQYSIPRDGTAMTAQTVAAGTSTRILTPTDVTVIQQDAQRLSDLTNVTEPTTPANGTAYALQYNSSTQKYAMVPAASATVAPFNVTFNARADSSTSLTSMPATEQFFVNSKRSVTKQDLTGYSQARLVVNVATASASINNPRLKAKFKTSLAYSSDLSMDFTDLGWDPAGNGGLGASQEMSVSLATAGLIVSNWINLAPTAKADVFLAITQLGGDGTITPGIGTVVLQVK